MFSVYWMIILKSRYKWENKLDFIDSQVLATVMVLLMSIYQCYIINKICIVNY